MTTREIEISFAAGGESLAGLLRLPEGADESAAVPGLVFTGPFTGVKEQVVSTYARALTARGFATLVFDHRGWGASTGEPRRDENAAAKLDDLLAATSVLANHDAVDAARLGCVGICLGGGYALKHAAFDPRIRAAAFVAAAFNSPYGMREGMGDDGYAGVLSGFAEARTRADATGELEYLPAVDPDGGEAAMSGREPWDYYGTERSAAAGWSNSVTRRSIRELLTLDAAMGADFLTAPALYVHGRTDAFCSPEGARATFERTRSAQKDLVWLDTTNHIDLYDNAEYVDPAVDAVARWFDEHLRA